MKKYNLNNKNSENKYTTKWDFCINEIAAFKLN